MFNIDFTQIYCSVKFLEANIVGTVIRACIKTGESEETKFKLLHMILLIDQACIAVGAVGSIVIVGVFFGCV